MEVGFETIGNATLICHDHRPILVTDPWITGSPYFGSWTFSHEIPAEQMEAMTSAEYAWISHGHPDHLSLLGLRELKVKRVLLPNHVGGRIAEFLRSQGYAVEVLKDRVWYPISDRIRILSISDYNQDGILLLDINGRLVVNLNDATDRGWGGFVRSIVKQYRISYLMRLSGFGDADMINIFDDQGQRIEPAAAKKEPVGKRIAAMNKQFGVSHFVPFSSMHRYQREDSIWAAQYTTELSDYEIGFDSSSSTLLPAFIRVDCARDSYEMIDPPERPRVIRDPKEFRDDWAEELSADDTAAVKTYFRSIEHLERHFDFINVHVGGRDNVVSLAKRGFHRGFTFEVPRTSLMVAIESETFDDLLIGNFMKTKLHGGTLLYPHFTPYVAKYADNARAKTQEELRRYFREYLRRAPFEYLRDRFERRSRDIVRSLLPEDSGLYRITRHAYHRVRGW
jgi:hypothetical protein